MFDDLVASQGWCRGHVFLVKNIQPLAGRFREQYLLNDVESIIHIMASQLRRFKARIFKQVRSLKGAAQRFPLLVGHGGYGHIPVLCFVDQIDKTGRRLITHRLIDIGLASHVRSPEKIQYRVEHG